MSTLRQAESSGKRITGVGVLDRSVGLLDLLADGPRTLRWLADTSGLPRPTAYRLLVALEAHRLVSRDATGAFQLGPRLTELAVRAGPAVDLAALAGPVLARLHEATGESVQLYVRSGDRRLCVAARDAGTGLRDSVPVGALLPLDVGSGGKVLLAWSPDAAHHPPTSDPAQPDAVRSPADWAAELAAVRKRGWAASVAEREPGVASVSAPVLADGQLLGALCVSGPATRIGQAPGKRLAPLIVQAAADLARLA
ncbi:MAG TPA: IclR family transcriptional regulator [Streptosporangiaceae bacterium]|jgi:DNA-binding IclR family transcriptional regulator|nr:IclR family transcriptional regulator [Streptosporangiaceae bacterium]